MTTQRTTTEIAAELTQMRAARTALLNGDRVEDVWRDGRRMRMTRANLSEINAAIADLEREYEQAELVESGRSRRRPINLRWAN